MRWLLGLVFGLAVGAGHAAPPQPPVTNGLSYFPLVPGSVYRYIYSVVQSSNPIVASTVTVTGGASWAGATDATVFSWASECSPGLKCDPVRREYYHPVTGGIGYLGIYAEGGSGAYVVEEARPAVLMLKPTMTPGTPQLVGTTFFYPGSESWATSANWSVATTFSDGTTKTNTGVGSMGVEVRQVLPSVTVAAGTFTNVLYLYIINLGYELHSWYAPNVGVIAWKDLYNSAELKSYSIPSVSAPKTVDVVEFYHAALDHYFISGSTADIAALDSGKFAGWARTGYSFKAIDPAVATPAGASPVCRFYGLPEAHLDSHFYSASPAECAAVAANFAGQWQLEAANVFQVYLPDGASGACRAGTQPIYRAWNGRADSNHRYTTSAAVQAQMVGKGYVAEGYGNPPVVMCSPQ